MVLLAWLALCGSVAQEPAPKPLWNPAFTVTIALEIKTAERRTPDPYLAVWIEDAEAVMVRTVALWFDHSQGRYLSNLSEWTRKQQSAPDPGYFNRSVSGATRVPGKYTFLWDGRDDHDRTVGAGRYTVSIEMAQEHGPHCMVRHTMDFSGAPKRADVPGEGSLTGVSIDYHRK